MQHGPKLCMIIVKMIKEVCTSEDVTTCQCYMGMLIWLLLQDKYSPTKLCKYCRNIPNGYSHGNIVGLAGNSGYHSLVDPLNINRDVIKTRHAYQPQMMVCCAP